MKYWVLSRKVHAFIEKKEDPNVNFKAKILFGIQMVWIFIASIALEYGFFHITSLEKEFKPIRILIDSFATAPPFILVFVLIDAFCLMKNVGGELR
jgi:hypothetical protein